MSKLRLDDVFSQIFFNVVIEGQVEVVVLQPSLQHDPSGWLLGDELGLRVQGDTLCTASHRIPP